MVVSIAEVSGPALAQDGEPVSKTTCFQQALHVPIGSASFHHWNPAAGWAALVGSGRGRRCLVCYVMESAEHNADPARHFIAEHVAVAPSSGRSTLRRAACPCAPTAPGVRVSVMGLFGAAVARAGTLYVNSCGRYRYRAVAPLSLLTMRLDTFTGSKSFKIMFVRQLRSSSFQRASGVPMRPPLRPLSARMIP